MRKPRLMTPGPAPVPEDVMLEMARPVIHSRDPRTKDFSREQELQVRARLKEGQDFKVFESGLVRTAEQLLRVLLAPLEKEVTFETEPGGDTMELFAYLDEHNRELQSAIAALRNHPASARPLLEDGPAAEPEI